MKNGLLFICDSNGSLAPFDGLASADPINNIAIPTDSQNRLFYSRTFHAAPESTGIAFVQVYGADGVAVGAPVLMYAGRTVDYPDVRSVKLTGVLKAGTLVLCDGAYCATNPKTVNRSVSLAISPNAAVNDALPVARAYTVGTALFSAEIEGAVLLSVAGFDPANWLYLSLGVAVPVIGMAPRHIVGDLACFTPIIDIASGVCLPGGVINPWDVIAFHGRRSGAGIAANAQYPQVVARVAVSSLYRRSGVTGFGV